MNFRPELAEAVMAGTKTVTRRIASTNARSPWWVGGCGLRVGADYAVCPGRGRGAIGRVRITSKHLERLGHLSDEEARAEGFPDAATFEATFAALNGVYDPAVRVWRIGFEVLRP